VQKNISTLRQNASLLIVYLFKAFNSPDVIVLNSEIVSGGVKERLCDQLLTTSAVPSISGSGQKHYKAP
jgi:hypothetical protein